MTPDLTEAQLREILTEIEKDCCSPWEAETVQTLARQCLALMDANKELRENVEDWFAKFRAVEREHEAAEARAEKAEALLRPFAKEGGAWWHAVPDDYHPGILEPNQRTTHAEAEFSIGDLRRAAAHLAPVPQQTKGTTDAENNSAHT